MMYGHIRMLQNRYNKQKKVEMNFNLEHCYHQLSVRGKITAPIHVPESVVEWQDVVNGSWPLHSFDFYIALDVCLTEAKEKVKQLVAQLKVASQTNINSNQTILMQLTTLLKEWLRVVKKFEFYHLESYTKDLFYGEQGILNLYEYGNMQTIQVLSEIEKYRIKNADEQIMTFNDLRKDEIEVIFKDISLKISKHLLNELKNEMYYPSKQLVVKLLKFYGFSFDFSKNFTENYNQALKQKKAANKQHSRQGLIIYITLKIITCFDNGQNICYFISYLKNILLDRSNGVLTAEYETWVLLYETCLKTFVRYNDLRQKQLIEIDQILSSSHVDLQAQSFMLKNILSDSVSLSSINFFIKNCRKEDKQQLKSSITKKIDYLMEHNMWKYIEDIFQFIEHELEGASKEYYLQQIKNKLQNLVKQSFKSERLYEVEYGLTFIIENMIKYFRGFEEIMTQTVIKSLIQKISDKPSRQTNLILFRFFNQFLNAVYSQTSYEQMDLPNVRNLLATIRLFQNHGFLCHKSVFKLVYYLLSSNEYEEQVWQNFFTLACELYFCGSYDENSDLEVIHSHESYRELLSSKILQMFQIMINSQILERKNLLVLLDKDTNMKKSYFTIRGFKDGLTFQSIQNICLVFNSHLSMQTLEFGLNYCTPFMSIAPWQPEETQLTLLSLISQQMPIQTLKFIYKELSEEFNFDYDTLQSISPQFWGAYWSSQRKNCAIQFSASSFNIQKLEALTKLRRLQFIINLSSCVFDKLNENSQKNIKQIKVIYENGANTLISVINKLKTTFLQSLNIQIINRVGDLSEEEIRNLEIIDEEEESFLISNYVKKNNFLLMANQFNMIGKINESSKVTEVQEAILPQYKQAKLNSPKGDHDILYKQIELILILQTSFIQKIIDKPSDQFSIKTEINKQWAKNLTSSLNSLNQLMSKKDNKSSQSIFALNQLLNSHMKCLVSKILLPEILAFILTQQCKLILSKHLFSLIKTAIQTIYNIDSDYEQHFIGMIEKMEDIFKENKNKQIQSPHILSLLQLFFELIFNKIRIRSYHIYRIIKIYQKITCESMEQFNVVIAQHIRVLFEQFITNYKNISEIQQLCPAKKCINPLYTRFVKHQHNLNYIQIACTLSMFINLFCRLNYSSLALGVEKIFNEEEAKAIYIDYLSSLTRKIVTEEINISVRDLEILKVDVYGNLNIITKSHLSERLMNKLISLAKNLLRVKVDLKGVNKLPIKILAEKIASEQLNINLEEFEDECKAISLGAISVHKKLAIYITSNLHLCNLYFVTGKHFQRYIELNSSVINKNKQQLAQQVNQISKSGISALNIEVNEQIIVSLEGLMRKLEKYYQICLRDIEYAEKLYSIFKIICISCMNNPQIIPFLLPLKLTVNKSQITFYDFTFHTLKICLPLFCQFYTTIIKTNCGFIKLSEDETISRNLQFELSIKRKLITLFKQQSQTKGSQYPYLSKAINYVQQYSESNRFRFYKFVKISHQLHENILKEFERQFNQQIIKICEQHIQKGQSSFSSFEIYELLQVALEKYHSTTSVLDMKKIINEQSISKSFCPVTQEVQSNKQNHGQFCKKSRETESARSKLNHENPQIKQSIANLASKINISLPSLKLQKGKKAKDSKSLKVKFLQEDLINVNDSKFLVTQWNSTVEQRETQINKIMVEKFIMFNEEIENRQIFKDAVLFPSKTGLQLISKDSLQLGISDGINEDQNNEDDILKNGQNSCNIIQSVGQIKQISDKSIEFSEKKIEEAEEVFGIVQNDEDDIGHQDSIIYSQIEIDNNEDGSMKLFGEQQPSHQEGDEVQEQITKDSIIQLIEEYTLNPEAIKLIALKIKYLQTNDLERIHAQQSGQIAYVIESQLRSRGILFQQQLNRYQTFFMDESKIYERLRNNKRIEDKEVLIPQFSSQFLENWFKIIFSAVNDEKANQSKRISSFTKKMLLSLINIQMITSQAMKIITMDESQLQLKYQKQSYSKKTAVNFKWVVVDHIFGLMIQNRTALPIIFYGLWDEKSKKIIHKVKQNSQSHKSVIEIILSVLIKCGEKQSIFLNQLIDYTQSLSKVTRFQYPYFDIQDSISISPSLIEDLFDRMHTSNQTFSENDKYFKIIRTMTFLQVTSYKQFFKYELSKTCEVIRKSYQKQESLMQLFRKNYAGEEGLAVERKAEIYWQLRKTKNAQQFSGQLVFHRKMLTDMASIVLDKLKQCCFTMYYKIEEIGMKEQLLYLRRKLNQVRHYSQKFQLQQQFKQKQRRYLCWKRNLINLIIIEQIVPAIEQISIQFLLDVLKTSQLLGLLYQQFHQIIKTTPIIFKQSAEYYKIILAYELLKKEEEQNYHSMSTLKTIPSIQSTRQMEGGRRRSSIARNSVFQMNCVDVTSIIKRSALIFTYQSLGIQSKNPIFGIHAKYSDMETKLKFLRQQNKLGEKLIEVSRETMWLDTLPHLDHTFGQHDIKIKITGQIGIDYGGVTREWINLVVKEILDPKLGLFELNANQLAFQPSRFSYLVPNHLDIFHKFGILVGKAMKENWLLQINFTKSFLKHMLGAQLYVQDLQDLEPDTAKGLLWILKNYVDEDIGLNFTYQEEILENKRNVQLVPGGNQVYVNQMNKKEYVKKLAYTKMTENIRQQSLAFISGVEQVIPTRMLKLFNYKEIGKYLAGVSTIDISQMRQYARYEGYSEDNENIKCFWEVMETKSEQFKAQFLFFLTGSYRVPYSGFKQNPITINKMPACKDYLPVAHTCFSIIDLPQYTSQQKMDRMLTRAIKEGKGFTVS